MRDERRGEGEGGRLEGDGEAEEAEEAEAEEKAHGDVDVGGEACRYYACDFGRPSSN
jgi:hypothetical protein